jgi:periplasmic protein TonB
VGIAIVLAVALQASGAAADASPTAVRTLDASVFRKPNSDRLQRILHEGLSPGVEQGSAVIECKAASDGRLRECFVAAEDPVGKGVGRSVLRMVQLFRMPAVLPDGLPVDGGTVRVPVHFGAPPN